MTTWSVWAISPSPAQARQKATKMDFVQLERQRLWDDRRRTALMSRGGGCRALSVTLYSIRILVSSLQKGGSLARDRSTALLDVWSSSDTQKTSGHGSQ